MELWKDFRSLYFSTLLLMLGSGLLSTFLGLYIAQHANGFWVGALMTSFYLGLVLGGKLGHKLIARVGHIRAFVACAGFVTAAIMCHGLTEQLSMWLLLRFLVGLSTMCMYMVIESWLNEQSTTENRGIIFSGYMMAAYMGLVLGQLVLASFPELGSKLLLLVAICYSMCLVPVALTKRLHPNPLKPARLAPLYYFKHAKVAMITSFLSGMMEGSFYGLAPFYAKQLGFNTTHIGLFVATCIVAGVFIQWPMGWFSDHFQRPKVIRAVGVGLILCAIPLAVLTDLNEWTIFAIGAATCAFLFSVYPLAIAFANDHIAPRRRVSLTAVLLAVFGLGASIGPISAGLLMTYFGPNMLFTFFAVAALLIVLTARSQAVPAPIAKSDSVQHMHMPSSLTSSPLVVALDPRIDEDMVQEEMVMDAAELEAHNYEPEGPVVESLSSDNTSIEAEGSQKD